MASNWKCVVRYDGTEFNGWQIQPNQRTVQGVIEDALGQVINFEWPEGEPPGGHPLCYTTLTWNDQACVRVPGG